MADNSGVWGAPGGIMAAQDQANQNDLTQMKLLEGLGTAKLNELNVQEKQNALDQQKALLEIERKYQAYNATVPATKGRNADVTDLEDQPQTSLADPLRKKMDWLVQGGAPTSMIEPLAKEIAAIQEKEAITGYRNAQATEQRVKVREQKLGELGAMAATAAGSPMAYTNLYQQMLASNHPLARKLTGNYFSDKPLLDNIATSSMTAKQQSEEARAKERAVLQKKLDEAGVAQRYAAAATSKKRAELIGVQADTLKKHGGEGTPQQVATREAADAMAYERALAARHATHTPIPLDPTKIEPGKTYTFIDGSVGRAVQAKGADGLPQFVEIMAPLKKPPQARSIAQIVEDRKGAVAAVKDSGVGAGADDTNPD